ERWRDHDRGGRGREDRSETKDDTSPLEPRMVCHGSLDDPCLGSPLQKGKQGMMMTRTYYISAERWADCKGMVHDLLGEPWPADPVLSGRGRVATGQGQRRLLHSDGRLRPSGAQRRLETRRGQGNGPSAAPAGCSGGAGGDSRPGAGARASGEITWPR